MYRKWRPATFDDVVGQEHITTTLKNQVKSGMLSHAYLFCGSRGTGKTSCSKILAKAVNCPSQKDGNPCGICDICKGIDNDSILDVTEIDAASNSGVDNIRDLREEANFTPVSTKFRVYIIDEAHMLSIGAFNALLKIMEDPPPHVLFILATTEIHKVPTTILSRCQRFDFQRIPAEDIAGQLAFVADQEKATLTDESALLIARLSDGGMRDALSLLDLCLSLGGDVTPEMVREVAGLSDDSYLSNIAEIIVKNDYSGALTLLSELWVKSIDPQQFTSQLISFYRNLLVVKITTDPKKLLEVADRELEELKRLAKLYSPERLMYSLSTLADTQVSMAKTPMRRNELEIGLLKLCNPAVSPTMEALLTRIEALENQLKHKPPTGPQLAPSVSVDTQSPSADSQTVSPSLAEPPTADSSAPTTSEADDETATNNDPDNYTNLTKAVPFERWQEVLEVLKQKNKALFGTLVESSAYIVGDLLLVDAGSELFTQMVRSDDYARDSLRDASFTITGVTYRLGPYQPEKYQIDEPGSNIKLDEMLKSARQLGLDLEVKE